MNKEDFQNPFPGLRPFYFDDSYLFFGRDAQITELASRLRKNKFLAVVGTSGSGKSSLVRAGLLPELLSGTMVSAGSLWETAIMRPGGDPITNLAESIVQADLYDPEEEEIVSQVRATLTRSGLGLIEAIRQCDIEEGSNLLIVVDQFEEIFRFRGSDDASDEQAAFFVNLLLEATEQSELPIYVIITMRSDFLGDCSGFPRLANSVNEGEFLIPRLNRDQRKEAIEGPIRVAGGEVSKPLLNRLLNDIGDDPDQLPILQHALMRTWGYWAKHSDRDSLDLDDYRATGGMTEALSRHANEVYAALPSDGHRKIAEKVFKNLTEKIDQGRGIRRPMPFGELLEIVQCPEEDLRLVVNEFRAAGRTFLMPAPTREIDLSTVIDISHESLMRVWTRLKDWVDDESQSARIYRRLADTAQLFEEGKAGYYRDPDLQIAMSWKEEAQPNHLWADRYYEGFDRAMQFLDKSYEVASQEEIEKENARIRELESAKALAAEQEKRAAIEKRSAKRLRVLSAGLAVAGIASLVFLVFAINSKNEVSNKINELAARSFLRAQELENEKDGLKALPWYLDAVELSIGDEKLSAKYAKTLSDKLSSNFILERGVKVKNASDLSLSNDGKVLAVSTNLGPLMAENKIFIYSWPNLTDKIELRISGRINETKISPDGGYVFSSSNIESKVWDISGVPKIVFQKPYLGSFSFNTSHSDGYHLFGSNQGLIGLNRGFSTELLIHDREVVSTAITPDGKVYISAEEIVETTSSDITNLAARRRIRTTEALPTKVVAYKNADKSFEAEFEIEFEGFVSQILFPSKSAEGLVFFAKDRLSRGFRQVNFTDGNASSATMLDFAGQNPGSLDMQAGGDKVLVSSSAGFIQLIEKMVSGWQVGQTLPYGSNYITDISSHGLDMLTAESSGLLKLWSTHSKNQTSDTLYGKTEIMDAIFGPSDDKIVVAFENGEIKIFEIPLGKLLVSGSPYQTTIARGRGPWLAVDGVARPTPTAGARSTDDFTATSIETKPGDPYPTWGLKFDKKHKVTEARVWNRPSALSLPSANDTYLERLKNYRVTLKLEDQVVWQKDFFNQEGDKAPHPAHELNFDNGIEADCFEISILEPNENNEKILSISEVQIFAVLEKKNVQFGDDLSSYVREVSSHELLSDGRMILADAQMDEKIFANYENKDVDHAKILSSFLKAFDSQNWPLGLKYFVQIIPDQRSNDVYKKAIICYRQLGDIDEAESLLNIYLSSQSPNYSFIVDELFKLDELGIDVSNLIVQILNEEEFYQDFSACKSMSLFLVSSDKYPLGDKLHEWVKNEYTEKSSYAVLQPSEKYDLKEAITIEGWFKHDSRGFYSWAPRLINKFGQAGSDGYCITAGGSGKLIFELNNGSTGEAAYLSIDLPAYGEWYHLAATWDMQSKQMMMYINGEPKGDRLEFNGPIGVSRQPLGFATNNFRNMRLDASFSEIRIWDYARSADEIIQNKDKRIDQEAKGLVFYGRFSGKDDTHELNWDIIENPKFESTNKLPFEDSTEFLALTGGSSFEEESWLDVILVGSYLEKGEPANAIEVLEASNFRFRQRSFNPARLGALSKYLFLVEDGNAEFRDRMLERFQPALDNLRNEANENMAPFMRQLQKIVQQDLAESGQN